MIVACQRCATQFQLDDSRIRGDGIRVRCSRCKHAFFVPAPGRDRTEEDEVDRLVRAAIEEEPPEPPDVTHDLPPPEAPRVPAAASDELRDEIPFESDWQFNDDSAPGAVFGEPAGDLGSEDPLDAARRAVDELLSGASDAPADVPPLAADVRPRPGEPERPVPTGAAPADLAEDDAGDEWDFDLAGAEPSGGPAGAARETPREERAKPIALAGAGDLASLITGLDARPSRLGRWLRRAGQAAGWTAVLSLVAVALYGSLAASGGARWIPGVQQAAGLVVESQSGRWLENASVGTLYVVSGTVRATGSGAAPGERPALRLVDRSGRPIPGAVALLGAPQPRSRILESDPAALAVLPLAAGPLRAGAARPFQALFADVPRAAAGVRLEAVALPAPAAPDDPAGTGSAQPGPEAGEPVGAPTPD